DRINRVSGATVGSGKLSIPGKLTEDEWQSRSEKGKIDMKNSGDQSGTLFTTNYTCPVFGVRLKDLMKEPRDSTYFQYPLFIFQKPPTALADRFGMTSSYSRLISKLYPGTDKAYRAFQSF
ncbi:MAG: hypothetical protein JXR87_08435, partial [Candidatus Marinimicrobia bacterium]|nr:hypothetical protein [Candidatus Neomarinimicrobiota bacterium]